MYVYLQKYNLLLRTFEVDQILGFHIKKNVRIGYKGREFWYHVKKTKTNGKFLGKIMVKIKFPFYLTFLTVP